jgi:hypothetical protein
MRTPGVPLFRQKKKFRYGFGTGWVRVRYRAGRVRYGSGTGRDKTEPEMCRVNPVDDKCDSICVVLMGLVWVFN